MDPKKTKNIFDNEVRIFNAFKNIILSEIERINKFTLTYNDPEYRNMLIIIAGGSAFEYYFTNTKGDSLLQTTDFDIRFSYKGQDFSSGIVEKLFSMRNQCIIRFCDVLNDHFRNSIDPEIDNIKNFILPNPKDGNYFFVNTNIVDKSNDFSKIKTVSYYIIDNGNYYHTSIIDAVIDDRLADSAGEKKDYLNKSNNEIYEGFFKYSIDSDNVKYPSQEGLTGFLHNDISLPESYISISSHYPEFNNVYIVSLSYLLWDTFKMLNISILKSKYVDEIKLGDVKGIDITNIDYEKNKYIESLKLKRYIYKYSEIIKAFEEPHNLLSCQAPNMQHYIKRCGIAQRLGSLPLTLIEPYGDTQRMYPNESEKIEFRQKYNY